MSVYTMCSLEINDIGHSPSRRIQDQKEKKFLNKCYKFIK